MCIMCRYGREAVTLVMQEIIVCAREEQVDLPAAIEITRTAYVRAANEDPLDGYEDYPGGFSKFVSDAVSAVGAKMLETFESARRQLNAMAPVVPDTAAGAEL